MRGFWRWLAVLSCIAWSWPAAVHARRGRLVWERPPHSMCPSAETLRRDVAEMLGYDPFDSPERAEIILRGGIAEGPDGVTASIEALDLDARRLGVRTLRAPAGECAQLRRPLALILAISLGSAGGPAGASRTRTAPPLWLGPFVALSLGPLPRATPGAGVDLSAQLLARLSLGAQLAYWAPVDVATRAGLGAKFQALDATFELCPRLTPVGHKLALSACVGAQAGALLARAHGLEGPDRHGRLSARALFDLKLSGKLGPYLQLEAALGPSIALVRPRFYLTRADESPLDVHRPALFGAFFRLTLFFALRSS